MLSVLLPVYRYPSDDLIRELHKQCLLAGIEFEILVGDDSGDAKDITRLDRIADLDNVTVLGHEVPLGRSANRNFLARHSKFPWLLFIDGDAGVASDAFISQYVEFQQHGAEVICGGTLYRENPPESSGQRLRWHYGRAREMISSTIRNRYPWRSFSSFNFMIHREAFLPNGFDESISGYGHEDTLLGISLMLKGVRVLHTDNGIYHDGIEENDIFLAKTADAVSSLVTLYRNNKIPHEMAGEISLLKRGLMIRRMHLGGVVLALLRLLSPWIEKRLRQGSSRIMLLDLFKLHRLLSIL